jgi:predicted dehydrogenase
MTKTRIGLIGAGGIAGRHLGNLLGFDDVAIVGVADPALDRAEAAAGRAGGAVAAYADHRAMLDREELDAAYVCTPPFAHGAPELALVERGLPFFVEKPLAADLATAEEVARAVEAAGLVTAVGYHWRYLDTVEEVQGLLARNPARLVTGHWLAATPPPAWWRRDALSGGQVVEQTTHVLDLARLLVGEVEEVHAAASRGPRPDFPDADVSDVSAATLRFAGGAVGTVASTCILSWRHRVGLDLFCEGMAIEFDEFELAVDVGRGRPVRQARGDPFLREDRDFVDAVRGKPDRIRAPYREALRTHRLAAAVARSARERRPVRLVDTEEEAARAG